MLVIELSLIRYILLILIGWYLIGWFVRMLSRGRKPSEEATPREQKREPDYSDLTDQNIEDADYEDL
jgi:hypothetical protein